MALLQPAKIIAPANGTVEDTGKVGTAIHEDGLVAKLQYGDRATQELRSPITGRIRSLSVDKGLRVSTGQEIATIDPGTEQVWEALRALYLVGQPEDTPAVLPYERELPDIPDHVRKQATETEKAIRDRTIR